MKTIKFSNFILVFMIPAVMWVIVSCQSSGLTELSTSTSTEESTATSAPQLTSTQEPTATTPPSPEPSPTIDAQMILSQTVDEMQIDIRNIRRDDGQLKADLCFPILDQDDWMLDRLVLKYNDKELRNWGASQTGPYIPVENGKMGHRCMTVFFDVPQQDTFTEFSLTVLSISAMPREGQFCERMNAAQGKLAESGISVRCIEENGLATYDITSQPDAMTVEEATMIITNIINRVTPGPWEFTVKLQ